MKILIAEDDRSTRLRVSALLSQWGHEIIAAANGLEAWDLYCRERPQLILTDWLMPGIDGVELVERIRKESTAIGAYAYIIMLTARADTADLVKGMDAGADDFIAKPFANDELRARLRVGKRLIELERTLEDKNHSLALANAEISAANRQMRRELEAAVRIHHSLLPSRFPLTERAHFAWHHEPCDRLSGDMLNILPLDESRFGLYMLDVCDHGVTAVLRSAHVSHLFLQGNQSDSIVRHESAGGDEPFEPPARVASQLNKIFPSGSSSDDVQNFTLLYGILDLEKKSFEYTSAGHPGPIIVPANKKKEAMIFEADRPAVGFSEDAHFTQQRVSLDSGDRIYLYTDGVFEVRNSQGEEFGELRLADKLADLREAPLEHSIHSVLGSAREWNHRELLDDDASILGVEVA